MQRSYIRRVNIATQNTEMADESILRILEITEHDSSKAMLNYHAGMAWNTDFWLQGISPHADGNVPLSSLMRHIESTEETRCEPDDQNITYFGGS
jgi:superoxide dismutase